MTFDEKIVLAVEDIPIPDMLSPDNIEAMLRSKRTEQRVADREQAHEKHAPAITVTKGGKNPTFKDAAIKITAAVAACFVILTGVLVYRDTETGKPDLPEIVKYADIPAPQTPTNYTELYEVYTNLQLDGIGTAGVSPHSDFRDSDTDIVKTDGKMVYTLWNGILYIIDPEQSVIVGTVETTAHPPVEMYVDSGNLFLISNETSASDSAVALYVESYDITDPASPVKVSSYAQCGEFTSGKLADGRLVLVSSYSDYRTAPLLGEEDLKGYVPYYLIGEKSYFVDADNIYVPANASSTDYTVVSAINCENPADISVKAVLGSGDDTYCTADSLYVFGKGQDDFSIISKFDLTDGSFTYMDSRSVDGIIPGRGYLSEDDDGLRVVTAGFDENGLIAQNVYLLDDSMEVVSAIGGILPGKSVSGVKFTDGFVFFYTGDAPAFVVNSGVSPMIAVSELTSINGNVYSYGDNILSFMKTENGCLLSLYDTAGTLICEFPFAGDEGKIFTSAENDPRAIYMDADGYIGIPVHSFDEFGTENRYYILKADGSEITEQTVIRYSDIDDANIFERAIKFGDTLSIIGGGRIVRVRISDWKVLSATDFFTR